MSPQTCMPQSFPSGTRGAEKRVFVGTDQGLGVFPKRGAGFLLPGDWGCPPDLHKSPKTGGFRGFKKDSTRDGAVEARRAHNPKAVGSNPTPATNETKRQDVSSGHCPAF